MPSSAINPFLVDVGAGVHGVLDIRDYGAVCDGATDDSGAIQDAIDAAWALGGGIVVITGSGSGVSNGGSANADNVVVDSTVYLRSGVWLRGLGSTTVLTGAADPIISFTADDGGDRMTLSDLLIQQAPGDAVVLVSSGANQLGWPRVTIQNITVADAVGMGIYLWNVLLECRLINCVTLRSGGTGIYINQTDNMLIGCTAAEGSGDGISLSGGNNKLTCCKAYGNDGNGFLLGGAGRHLLAGCESQDNGASGYHIVSEWNALSGCLADTDNLAGVTIVGNNNSVDGSFMHGGGGTGQITKAGVFFGESAIRNNVRGVSNCVAPAGGKTEGNLVQIGAAVGSRMVVDFTSPWTPTPYQAETQAMTLTGALTLVNPVYKHVGQRMTLELTQDAGGGRTVTFPDEFRPSWTPDTTGGRLNIITLEYDGSAWQQVSASVGIVPRPSLGRADTFNRGDEALNVSSSGHTWEKANPAGSWQVVSNAVKTSGATNFTSSYAVLDATAPDFTAQVTLATATIAPGLVWRYSDSSNLYAVFVNEIRKIVAGTPVAIASGILNLTSGDVVRVRASGPNHFVYKNGTLEYVFTDDFNVSATKAGITSQGDADILDSFTID